jgi:ABC transporter substrate binding protein
MDRRAFVVVAAVNLLMPRVIWAQEPAKLQGVEVGYLRGFGPDLNGALRSGAEYVDKILRGAKAADMPIEQPTKFKLVINLKPAKALGVTIPPPLLLRAEVIQ